MYKKHGDEYAWIGFLDFDEYLRWNSKKKIETMFQQYQDADLTVSFRASAHTGVGIPRFFMHYLSSMLRMPSLG